jgi:hypothetical protein
MRFSFAESGVGGKEVASDWQLANSKPKRPATSVKVREWDGSQDRLPDKNPPRVEVCLGNCH